MKKLVPGAAVLWLLAATFAAQLHGQATSDGAVFTADGKLQRPENYREWVYATSGLGMTYGPNQPAAGQPRFFDNVFVSPNGYREFMKSGKFPEGTVFVLEIRRSAQNASIDNGGQTQGDRVTMEVEVKDRARFPDTGWGFFDFSGGPGSTELKATGERLPLTASCYTCHRDNTAVENNFVQFYPTLMDVARKMGTVKPTYDPNHKVQPVAVSR